MKFGQWPSVPEFGLFGGAKLALVAVVPDAVWAAGGRAGLEDLA